MRRSTAQSGAEAGGTEILHGNEWMDLHLPRATDVAGLINLIGGRDKFVAKLDKRFQDQFEGFSGDPEPFRGGGFQVLLPSAQFPGHDPA